jgi:transcriptional regulator with XRE-family HTH domain
VAHKRLPSFYAEDAVAFGKQVRDRRESRGWSQDKLIAMSGHAINKKTLQRIERGQGDDSQRSPANPELRVLIELCRVLAGRVIIDVNRPMAFTIEFDAEGDQRADPSV